ncbi:MAG: type VI secretion system-associated protein TagF [Chromatiales bacterium]|nr:type VI secretion system-associated protein TagF [Chromatiales bacterium]
MEALDIGVYGKLPAHADFVTHHIDADTSNKLYEWLQSMLYLSREQMGESDWLSAYLIAPPWYFLLTDEVQQRPPLLGAMLPSVDKVGRYFPLILTATVEQSAITGDWLFKEGSKILATLDRCGVMALQQRWRIDELTAYIGEELSMGEAQETAPVPEPGPFYEIDLLNMMEDELSSQNIGSIWWNASGSNSLCSLKGMPTVNEYMFMLTGAS